MARGRVNLPVELQTLLAGDWERVIGQAMLGREDRQIMRMYILERMPQIDIAEELHMHRSTVSRHMDKIMIEARRTAEKLDMV